MILAYPLQWPSNWPRTKATARTPNPYYQVTAEVALRDLLASFRKMGVKRSDIVISSNIPVRRDRLPKFTYAKAVDDPGIAVYWTDRSGPEPVPRVVACDRWFTTRDNLRAIGLSIDAMRMLKRSGATQVLDRAFEGLSALPQEAGRRHWRQVLGLDFDSDRTIGRFDIEVAYRHLAKQLHPDKPGGSHEAMQELNAARTAALKDLELKR